MQTAPRRVVARISLLLAVPLVAACGFNAQTDQVYQPAVGVNVRDSQVDVLNAMVVSSGQGSGRFIATLSNESQTHSDMLTGVTGSGSVQVATTPDVTIPATGDVNLATSEDGIGVTGSSINAVRSNFVTFQLTFEHAEPVTISVPVVTATGALAAYGSAPTTGPNDVAVQGSTGAFGR